MCLSRMRNRQRHCELVAQWQSAKNIPPHCYFCIGKNGRKINVFAPVAVPAAPRYPIPTVHAPTSRFYTMRHKTRAEWGPIAVWGQILGTKDCHLFHPFLASPDYSYKKLYGDNLYYHRLRQPNGVILDTPSKSFFETKSTGSVVLHQR
jgi:hypothetical protein